MLIIGTGRDTKNLSKVTEQKKTYEAVIQLGSQTDTLDTEGNLVNTMPVPLLNHKQLESILSSFKGIYKHKPPMFSAKKINGTRLYNLARKNITIEREEIISNIYNIKLNTFTDSLVDFSVTCSKGTYIRVLGLSLIHI